MIMYRVAQKKTIPKLTKMIDTNDIFGTNYSAQLSINNLHYVRTLNK